MSAKLYRPWADSDAGYQICKEPAGWRWIWIEPGEEYDAGSFHDSEAAAYRDAADDWDVNGAAVGSRLAATLRARATRLATT